MNGLSASRITVSRGAARREAGVGGWEETVPRYIVYRARTRARGGAVKRLEGLSTLCVGGALWGRGRRASGLCCPPLAHLLIYLHRGVSIQHMYNRIHLHGGLDLYGVQKNDNIISHCLYLLFLFSSLFVVCTQYYTHMAPTIYEAFRATPPPAPPHPNPLPPYHTITLYICYIIHSLR